MTISTSKAVFVKQEGELGKEQTNQIKCRGKSSWARHNMPEKSRPDIKVDNLLHEFGVPCKCVHSKNMQTKDQWTTLPNSNMEDAVHTFNNLLPQWQSSISINACNCITIFWRNPNNFHNACFMNLGDINGQTYQVRFLYEKLVNAKISQRQLRKSGVLNGTSSSQPGHDFENQPK